MSTHRHGFTLVELLVVIVIIGMLVALLLPAVRSATESARQATCLNNLKEIGTAIMNYEADKGHLPGCLNRPLTSGGTANVTWPMAILPQLGRRDLVDQARNNSGQFANVQINQFICPDDPEKGLPASAGPKDTSGNYYYYMSYVVPAAYFVNRSQATSTSGVSWQIGQIPNPAQTVMLGERTLLSNNATANPNGTPHAPAWTDATSQDSNGNYCLTFAWPTSGTATVTPNYLTSTHPGIVVVYFFDGHGDKVRDDTSTYQNPDGTVPPDVLVPQQ
jgi:prepilin-type N-terminal cleavage/methylation domain-containing protein